MIRSRRVNAAFRGRAAVLIAPALAIGLLAAACSSSPTASASGTGTSAPPPATTPPVVVTTPPSPTGGGSASSKPVTLKQGPGGSLTFAPANLTVTQGQVVTVKNVGVAPHTFTVTGQSINVTNAIGQSQKVTVNLPPGTYPFVCTFHQAQGMTGTLVVT